MPRKPKIQESKPYEFIRGMWESAYVSQFLRLFQCKFDFPIVNTQELEDALVDSESLIVADACARLLRYLTDKSDILISNYEGYLRHLLLEKCLEPNPLRESCTSWSDLNAEEKLSLLKWLVDYVYQEKEEDLMEYLDESCSPDDMRGICAGQDAYNNIYWYLDDLRLYRENSVKKPNRKDFECVCLTLSDWHSFLKQFRKTTNSHERELYSYLNDELFPLIEGQLKRLNEKDYRSVHLENKRLLFRECEALRKMIMDNKDKSELSTSAANVVKVEPKMDSVLSFSDKGDVLNGKPNTKVKCESDELALGGVGGDGVSSVTTGVTSTTTVTTSASCVVDKKPDIMTLSGDVIHGGGLQKPTTPVSTGVAVGGAPQPAELPCDVANSIHDDVSAIDNETLAMIKEENACSTPVSIKEEKSIPPMMSVSGPMTPSSMGPCIGPCGPMQQQQQQQQQPLMTNVIHKQPSTMEAQYMQQQSQIFVFSTQLANKAAEAVLQGQFASIIAYHCAQPGTKRFLEKHPLKIQQFNRQNPAMWLNSLAQMKQNRVPGGMMKQGMMPNAMYGGGGGVGGGGGGDHFGPNAGQNPSWLMNSMGGHHPGQMGGMGNMPNMDQGSWPGGPQSQQQQQQQQPGGNPMYNSINSPVGMPLGGPIGSPLEHTPPGPMGNPTPNAIGGMPSQQQQQQFAMNMGQGQQFPGMGMQPGGPGQPDGNMMNQSHLSRMGQPTLTGVKVPDENLTPQQRQHREEQLAIIRNMHQMLFPDQHQGSPTGDCGGSIGPGPGMMGQMSPVIMQGQGGGNLPPHVQQQQQQHHHHGGGVMMNQGQPNMMMSHGPGGQSPSPGSQQPGGGGGAMFPGHLPMGMMSPGPAGEVGPVGFCGGNGPMSMQQQQQQQQRMMMPGGQTGVSPASMAAQMEWHKLQHQFYEERRRKYPQGQGNMQQMRPMGVGGGSMQCGFPMPGSPMQGPGMPGTTTGQMGPGPGGGTGNSGSSSAGIPSSLPGTPRIPGPPPPYHQTPRNSNPGSVGMSGTSGSMPSPTSPSPNPNSSSLSLPSPRMSSGLSSPADATPRPYSATGNPRLPHPSPGSLQNTPMNSPNPRPLNPSNPGTPASVGGPMPSPGMTRKQSQDSSGGSSSLPSSTSMDYSPSTPVNLPPTNTQPQPAEGMFGRTLQSYAQSQQRQQQQQNAQPSPKEPNLMPVPSPQQIQYLNTFDGQELTIQKQPNTSLQDPGLLSPEGIPTSVSSKDGTTRTSLQSGGVNEQQQGMRPTTTSSQIHMGLMGDGFHGSASQSPVERFPTPGSQPHSIGPGMDPMTRFPTSSSSHPTTPGMSCTSVQSPLEAMTQKFTNVVGGGGCEGGMRFMGPGPGPRGNPGVMHQGMIPSPMDTSMQQQQQQQHQQRFQGPRQGNPGMVMDGIGAPRFPGNGSESPTIRYPGNGQLVGPSGPGRPGSIASPGYSPSPGHGSNMKGGSTPCSGGMFVQMSPGKVCSEMGGGSCTPTGFAMGQGQMSLMNSGMVPSQAQIQGQRLSHFDPISSMAQMSQSLAASNGMPPNHHQHHPHHQQHHPGGGVGGGGGGPPNMIGGMNSMNMANMQGSGNSGPGPGGPGMAGNHPSMVNFQGAGMQAMQSIQQQPPSSQQQPHTMGGPQGMAPDSPGIHHHQDVMNQVGQNLGPQTVNNTYVNATMSIQQLNIQNVTTSAYNPALQIQPMNPQMPMGVNQMQSSGPLGSMMNTNTVSSSVTMNPIVHSSVSPKNAMNVQAVSSLTHPRMSGPQQFSQAPGGVGGQQRLSAPVTGPISVPTQGQNSIGGMGMRGPAQGGANMPFNGANVQVKASAPNTIQYLPARPQNTANAPQRPPSLEFLQRFTGPMDGKGPTHNMQYFPHSGQHQQPQNMGMGMNMQNMGPNQMNTGVMGPGMNSNMGGGGMGMMSSGMGPGSQVQCMPRGHNPAMMRPGGGGPPQQMMSGQMYSGFPSSPSEQAMYGGMQNHMMSGPPAGSMGPNGPNGPMYAGSGGKVGHMSSMGMGLDSSQPLPPSMGQSAGFKQSPFLGPTTADPNYAQQFHNFQQQLYATNTRGGQMTGQNAMPPGQTFFGNK